MNRTEQAILRRAVKREHGYTVTIPNARQTSRNAMESLRRRGLVVYEVRGNWAGNWLTKEGEKEL